MSLWRHFKVSKLFRSLKWVTKLMCSAEVFKDENPQLASHFCRSMFTGRLSQLLTQQKKPYNHSKGISKVCPTNQTVNAYQLQTKFGKTIPGPVSLWPTVTRAKGRVEPQNGGKEKCLMVKDINQVPYTTLTWQTFQSKLSFPRSLFKQTNKKPTQSTSAL